MKVGFKAYYGIAPAAVLAAGLSGCGSAPEHARPDASASQASPAAGAQTAVDELPDRKIEGIDVCAALPGNTVASAVKLSLVKAEPGPEMCSYTLRDESGSETGVQVVLTKGVSFLVTRNTSENATNLPGLGVAAFTRKVTGSQQDVWVARKDGLFFHVLGFNGNVAEPVAKLALETIP
jgi:hypothetical protein